MAVPFKRGSLLLTILALAMMALAMLAAPNGARADEIRLKGGRKLYGVIVAYEDNMFKIKTDFGYELIEKDKIESIIPSTPAGRSEPDKKESTKKEAAKGGNAEVKPETAVTSGSGASAAATNASTKTVEPAPPGKTDKAAPKITNAAVKPDVKPQATAANVTAPVMKDAPAVAASAVTAISPPAAAPAPPKEPEVPANKEEIQGNQYINYTHGFRMYKAPSWNLIEEARGALPNAIVAMGTANESTLLVVGEEKTKDSLETAASTVEKRLHEVYLNYQRLSERKTTVGGLPAVEYQYRGKADEHDWSGRLVIVSRGKDIFTVLAMTYADSDLIQIQENVIARSIASLDFSAH